MINIGIRVIDLKKFQILIETIENHKLNNQNSKKNDRIMIQITINIEIIDLKKFQFQILIENHKWNNQNSKNRSYNDPNNDKYRDNRSKKILVLDSD